MRLPRVLAAIVGAVLIVACGSGGDGGRGALADALLVDDGIDGFEISADEASCAADVVDETLESDLADLDFVTADPPSYDLLSSDEAGAVRSALDTCLHERVAQEYRGALADDDDLDNFRIDDEQADCVAVSVSGELGASRVAALFLSGDEADLADLDGDETSVVAQAIVDCVPAIERVLKAELANGLLEDPDESFPVTAAEADCVAARVVEEVPLADLVALGIAADAAEDGEIPFAEADAEVFTAAFLDCIDVRSLLLDEIGRSGVSDDIVACIDRELSDDDLADLVRAGIAGTDVDADVDDIIGAAVETCI